MLNYSDVDFSLEALHTVIAKRMKWYAEQNVDIMIVSKNKVIEILRYIK